MAPKESITATSPSLEEALLKADALHPSISLTHPNNVFTGEKLDKLKSNYKKWNKDMMHYLAINGLLSYILGENLNHPLVSNLVPMRTGWRMTTSPIQPSP